MARTVNLAEHAARRDAILDAAQRLILSKGYQRLTIQDILDELQISKGAFYHYFDCKPAVIEALTARLVDASVEALAPIVHDGELGALDKLQRFFGEVIRWNPRARACLWRCCRCGMHPRTLSSASSSTEPWPNDWRRCWR